MGGESRALFTDVSLAPGLGIGIGAYLVIPVSLIKISFSAEQLSEISNHLVLHRFEGTSSTTLEVQTVLLALEEYLRTSAASGSGKLQVYSDSQCIAGLLKRRQGLTADCFRSRVTNRPLSNASLYRRFYELHDELAFEVTKVKGHTRRGSRNAVQAIFSCLDRQARKALKLWMADR